MTRQLKAMRGVHFGSRPVEALRIPQPPEWMTQAACVSVGGDVFFPDDKKEPHHAKQVCEGCPVKLLCLQYALDNCIPHGVWGGLTPIERGVVQRRDGVVWSSSRVCLTCGGSVDKHPGGCGEPLHMRRWESKRNLNRRPIAERPA